MLYPNLFKVKTAAQLSSKGKDRAKVRKRTISALGGIGESGVNSKCHMAVTKGRIWLFVLNQCYQ